MLLPRMVRPLLHKLTVGIPHANDEDIGPVPLPPPASEPDCPEAEIRSMQRGGLTTPAEWAEERDKAPPARCMRRWRGGRVPAAYSPFSLAPSSETAWA